MRPIYKSLVLAATTLSISLTLNAETRDDESASTMALQAELLDSLRVELVAQGVSGARDLIASGECVIDGSNLTITLDTSEWTRGATYRVQVLATFGTQTQVIYVLNVTVPRYISLSDSPQEFSDNVTIVSTITDVTEADLEGLALEVTSQEIKTTVNGQAQDIMSLAQNYGNLAADIQALKDAHVLGFSYDGIIFEEGYEPRSAFGIIAEREYIIEVHDNKDTFVPVMARADYRKLKVFEMQNATTIPEGWMGHNSQDDSSELTEVIIPRVITIGDGNYQRGQFIRYFANLKFLNIEYFNFIPYAYYMEQNPKLIDIVYGTALTASSTLLRNHTPTEALLDNSISLLSQADIDAGFTSNREKLLYNIREHIVANLQDRTGLSPLTMNFSQTTRNAFDQTTEDAFAAKNWDIAPARS